MNVSLDTKYRDLFLTPVRVCFQYKPAFGTARGEEEITLVRFQQIFASDPLYHWIGLDSPLVYAAHKASGGMTSVYRQLGIGCERLVRAVIQDHLALSDEEVRWGYDTVRSDGKQQRLTLDARIDGNHIDNLTRPRLESWLGRASTLIGQHRPVSGAVFEVRQGYKSADSKRSNADLRFGLSAYDAGYLPVVMVVSNQVSKSVIDRYRSDKLLVLRGVLTGDETTSTYRFFDQVVGYSLSSFFERNATVLKTEVTSVLQALLSAR